jgi:hypothetical protein
VSSFIYTSRDTVTEYCTCTVDVHITIYSNNPELNSLSTKRRDARLLNPAALFPGTNRYPLHRKPGGPHSGSGQVRTISHPKGFEPRPSSPYQVTIPTTLSGPINDDDDDDDDDNNNNNKFFIDLFL